MGLRSGSVAMNRARVAKMISRYESGVVTSAEVATWLLIRLLSEPELDGSFLLSLDWLPKEVKHEFQDLLGKIRDADYHWVPFLITSVPHRSEPPDYPEKLRKICALVEERGKELGVKSPVV